MNEPPNLDPELMARHAPEASRLLKTLANEKRLRILCSLVGRELSVGELQNQLPELGQSALSQHLGVLRGEGLVTTRRQSQVIYYQLMPGPALELIRTLHGIYCRERDTRIVN